MVRSQRTFNHTFVVINSSKPGVTSFRNSHMGLFFQKGGLKNFAKLTGKHLSQRCSPEACKFFKKETLAQVFSCEFCEILKDTFFYRSPPVAAYFLTSYRISAD